MEDMSGQKVGENLNCTLDSEDFLQHETGVQVHLAVLNSIQNSHPNYLSVGSTRIQYF